MSTGNLTASERRRLGHEDVMFLAARRKKRFDKQFNRFSSEDEENDIEDDKVDIMNGLGNTSKELAEDPSDSDSEVYEFQE